MEGGARTSRLNVGKVHFADTAAAAECQGVGSLFAERQASGNREETYPSPTHVGPA